MYVRNFFIIFLHLIQHLLYFPNAFQTSVLLTYLFFSEEIDEQTRNEPPRLAMYHSDVDDTAESSSDEDGPSVCPGPVSPLDASGNPIPTLGGTSKRSKKLIQIVDKIADSKLFQAATDNKYIKNLMEGEVEFCFSGRKCLCF